MGPETELGRSAALVGRRGPRTCGTLGVLLTVAFAVSAPSRAGAQGRAAPGARPSPVAKRPKAIPHAELERARALTLRAENLRRVRLPLRRRAAEGAVAGAVRDLEQAGVRVDRAVPVVHDSRQEYALHREVGKLLRGAPPDSEAYALRREALTRARALRRDGYGLPRDMPAFTNADGAVEVVLNVDRSFWTKNAELVPILAHEHQHVRDIRRARRLAALLEQPELRDARPGTPAFRRAESFRRTLAALEPHAEAEKRAFSAQARAQALADRPLANWWRAPTGTPLDRFYPPAEINRALLEGYVEGVSRTVAHAMRDAAPERRTLAAHYLSGYRAVLEAQATSYFHAFRKDAPADTSSLEKYRQDAARVLAEREGRSATPRTREQAFLTGQADAYRGIPPKRPVLALLASP